MFEPYDLVHCILYYLHCDRITLYTNPDDVPSSTPKYSDIHQLSALAHRLEVVDLKPKILAFMGKLCTPETIMESLFSKFTS
jgi:hypothetical protein